MINYLIQQLDADWDAVEGWYQTSLPWSWLYADYSADGNPWLAALKHANDFMQAGDYSEISFWDCHSGEGQGQLSSKRSSLVVPILGPSPWLGILICLVNSGRSDKGISRAIENSWKRPRTNAFFFREWKQFLANCYNFKKGTPGFPGSNWTNLMIIHAEIYFLLISWNKLVLTTTSIYPGLGGKVSN